MPLESHQGCTTTTTKIWTQLGTKVKENSTIYFYEQEVYESTINVEKEKRSYLQLLILFELPI